MALFLTIRERCLTGGRPKPPCTNTKKQTRNHRHRPKHIARRVKRHGKASYNGQYAQKCHHAGHEFSSW